MDSQLDGRHIHKEAEFSLALETADSPMDVLNVYMRFDKSQIDAYNLDRVANRLLFFEDTENAMKFIEMAEKRRSDETLATLIGQKIELALENSKRV